MNIFKILLLVIASFSSLYAQKVTQFNFQISGYTEGVSVKLLGVYVDQNFLADTAKVNSEGKITFKNTQGFQEGMYYLLLPEDKNMQIVIVNGENNFTIHADRQTLSANATVEGSLENKLLYENAKFQANLEKQYNMFNQELRSTPQQTPQYQDIRNKMQALLDGRDVTLQALKAAYPTALFTKFKLAGQNPKIRFSYRPDGSLDSTLTMHNFRLDWWNDFDFRDTRLLRTPVFFNKMKKYIQEYTAQQPDSIIISANDLIDKTLINKEIAKVVIGWVTGQYKPAQTKLMDGEAVYSYLILKYFTPERFEEIPQEELKTTRQRATEMQASVIGAIGQNVWGKDKNNVKHALYDIKSDIKIVYVYNPDCEHCQLETPKLREIYDKWKGKGVEIFSIVANPKDKAEWTDFQNKYGVNWIDVTDPQLESHFNEKYYIDITPELYVLDKNFRIIAKNLKPEQLPEIFEKVLNTH